MISLCSITPLFLLWNESEAAFVPCSNFFTCLSFSLSPGLTWIDVCKLPFWQIGPQMNDCPSRGTTRWPDRAAWRGVSSRLTITSKPFNHQQWSQDGLDCSLNDHRLRQGGHQTNVIARITSLSYEGSPKRVRNMKELASPARSSLPANLQQWARRARTWVQPSGEEIILPLSHLSPFGPCSQNGTELAVQPPSLNFSAMSCTNWSLFQLHYITLHYITLHYFALHHITLHYITLRAHIHTQTYIHIYIHTISYHIIPYHYITYAHIHTYTHTDIHTYVHTYIRTYVHTLHCLALRYCIVWHYINAYITLH